jgi:hypothetical protein
MNCHTREGMSLLLYYAIHFDTSVGTYQCTTLTADAFVRICHVGKVVTAIIYFFLHQSQHVAGACYHTQVAAFATLGIDRYSASNFCHSFLIL